MKNKRKILITLALCALIIIYGSYFIKNQKKLAIEQFRTSEKQLIKEIKQEASENPSHSLVESTQDDSDMFLMVPTDSQATMIKDVQEDMAKLADSLIKNKDKATPTKTVLSAKVKNTQQNVTFYEYEKKQYDWSKEKKKWEESTQPLKEKTLINQLTGNKLTLGDIFINQQNLSKLSRNIQEELLAAAKDSKKDIEKILALPQLLATQTDFTYGDSKITIPFHQKNAYINTYTINYEQVGRFLNPDFISSHYLKETPIETVVPQSKVVALTFDDGPSDKTTPAILAILKKKKTPATFFMLGQQVEKFPDLVKTIADDGHELANHSYSHPKLTDLSIEDARQQINRTQAAIFKASGVLPEYVRPPYGSFNYETAVAIGLPLINWSVDSLDWKTKDSKKIDTEIKTTIGADSIILMHDIHQETADALEKLITDLQKDGYRFVTISDLLQTTPKPLTVYYSSTNRQDIPNQ
ncbi:polysaccharide deacetylase family protein [Vagococcus sp. BWB3-3]|uniref:Polysaccharide deacetylase family protein n=1 Tax=Vagococcus allomyrinae TaxID=2794353 RepID=A0A940P7Z0_9ENTE|nr:polysaccharide deacetylase family protein [Vagococcus allomyrinae]MBP1041356.1 polysaccharide deacetylase family protein [Vagococcus allomyrinae]